ncbi:Uncharacterised protein [Pseudomonas putida]|nr:Uncharacterised protein [Pseudomonas putida]
MLQRVQACLPVFEAALQGVQLLQVVDAGEVDAGIAHQAQADDLQGQAFEAACLGVGLGDSGFGGEHIVHGRGDDDAGDVLEDLRAPQGEAHHAGRERLGVGLAAHPLDGFEVLAGVIAQLQGQKVRAGGELLFGLEVLGAAFFLAVLERVHAGAE